MHPNPPAFSDLENEFIDGLVRVMETSSVAYEAEQVASEAMEANIAQANALREQDPEFNLDEMERYFDEAVSRSGLDESSDVVAMIREGILVMRAAAEYLNQAGLSKANSHLPVL